MKTKIITNIQKKNLNKIYDKTKKNTKLDWL